MYRNRTYCMHFSCENRKTHTAQEQCNISILHFQTFQNQEKYKWYKNWTGVNRKGSFDGTPIGTKNSNSSPDTFLSFQSAVSVCV